MPAVGGTGSQTSKLVQIGGQLVPPSQVSSTERRMSSGWLAAHRSSGGNSDLGRNLGIGIGAAALLGAVLVMALTAARRRHRLPAPG